MLQCTRWMLDGLHGPLKKKAMSNFEAIAPTLTNLMTSLLIENSRVLDVHALTLRTGLSVLVQDGRIAAVGTCLLYTSPSPRDRQKSRMPSSA